jgi:hypothetical protein
VLKVCTPTPRASHHTTNGNENKEQSKTGTRDYMNMKGNRSPRKGSHVLSREEPKLDRQQKRKFLKKGKE